MGRLEGKVAIITGAGRGIGRATALLFASEGAKVVVADIDPEAAKKVADEIAASKGEALPTKVDVSSPEDAEKMAKAAVDAFGGIDVLVNNAGIIRDKTLLKMSHEEFNRVIEVNLKGVFNCTKAVVPHMLEKGSGVILNASSVVALYGNFGQTNYVASKCAVIGMTKVWARELGPKGIRVNAVAPGFITTNMTESIPEEVKNAIVSRIPLGRMGSPEDVAFVYLFLASDEARYINGAVISVDGGMTV